MSNGTQSGISLEPVILMALDPVHVGTGGMRLGRVDNTIVREPGTRLPKIPGTGLSGAMRQYAAHRFNKLQCAGQGGHCGRPTCPICYTFGYVNAPNTGKSSAGVIGVTDARILLAPVYTIAGPAWVTCPGVLREFGLAENSIPVISNRGMACWKDSFFEGNCLNLGWLMMKKEEESVCPELLIDEAVPADIRERVVVVCDDIFSRIINANLEVRTSVSIDPETGAAKKGALFTYEAIPRTTVLFMHIIEDDFRGEFPSKAKLEEWQGLLAKPTLENDQQMNLLRKWHLLENGTVDNKGFMKAVQKANDMLTVDLENYQSDRLPGGSWNGAAGDRTTHVAMAGLKWAEHLGIGGMGTRGFGRIQVQCPGTGGGER